MKLDIRVKMQAEVPDGTDLKALRLHNLYGDRGGIKIKAGNAEIPTEWGESRVEFAKASSVITVVTCTPGPYEGVYVDGVLVSEGPCENATALFNAFGVDAERIEADSAWWRTMEDLPMELSEVERQKAPV
jgi:hypothetical protein